MNRTIPPVPKRAAVLIEALEPRIAPAGLLNESKFTSVAVGGTLLLDASGAPGTFQGLTTGSGGGSGSYLLYITSGRALVFTTDLNGNGRLDPGEITGIALGKDSLGHNPALILFSDVHGDIVTDLQGTKGSLLTDSDNNPNNGHDGRLLTDTVIDSITIRTLAASDIDSSLPGNTVANRLALTSFSIFGNIVAGGGVGAVTIDTIGTSLLESKFDGSTGDQYFTGAVPQIQGIYTGTAANNLDFHFTQNNPFTPQVEGTLQSFHPATGEHGGDIDNVKAASPGTVFSIGTLATGDGGFGARGGDLNNIVMHGATGGYEIIAGNGGDGNVGGQGGSINGFNDLGTVTSQVVLHTGDGGAGLLGKGGDGGAATFATTQIAAGVEVLMGRGGDGFTNGGNGASFTAGVFTTPETLTPVGSNFLGTWHNIGDVGKTHPLGDGTYAPEAIDFNGDGFGDGVFTTTAPDQISVVFGNGFGGLYDGAGNFNVSDNATVVLKVPGITNPVVTVGDFNGDGRPDIAVASGSASNFGGVYIFLDQIGTALDPINSRNYTHSLVGDHPFSAAHQSALPTLEDQGFYQTSGAVVALTAGDFNGDGITDLAYVQNVILESTQKTQFQTVGVLLGDAAHDPLNTTTGGILQNTQTQKLVGTGYFYANAAAPRAAAVLNNIIVTPHVDILEATSLTNANLPSTATGLPAAPEVFIFGAQADDHLTGFSLAVADPATHVTSGLIPTITIALGKVDTNRNTGPTSISATQATLQTFTIQDIDNNGSADVVVLAKAPQNFLVTFRGDGMGGFNVGSGASGSDNSGLLLGTGFVALTMTAVDPTGSGMFNGEGILYLPSTPGPFIQEIALAGASGTPNFDMFTATRSFDLLSTVQDQSVQALDAFYAVAPTQPTAVKPAGANLHPDTGYGILSPESTDYRVSDLFIFSAPDGAVAGGLFYFPTFERYLTENGYLIRSGDGGSATSGTGGNAGVVGATSSGIGSGNGAVAITFPAAQSYEGQGFLQGGNGGSGYSGGGIGGDVTGITVRYATTAGLLTSDAQLVAGNGGNGIGGDGGRGGNLSLLSIETGSVFIAGNAGNGLHGGLGGSITGNQTGVYDAANSSVSLLSGKGGEGALAGGNGGTISNWDSLFLNFIGTGGSLSYVTGSGGGSAGGNGGAGGSILNSSPDQNQNNLSGPLTLETGAGGNGLSGGNGGAITAFNNNSTTQSAVPTTLTVVTGNGGVGVSGSGGSGGTITNFSSNGTGLEPTFDGSLTGIGRVIAGDGGASYGGVGGVGGSLTNVVATATSTPLVVAAGAGGQGLTIGGNGGSVTNSSINSAALQIGKMLVVAGAGGDAMAAQPQDIFFPNDLDTTDLAHTILAFGNVRGTAGNGGNISGITQPVGAQTAVDLIAGNGGSTPNASTAITSTTGVGHGGSVTGVTLTGTVGAISRDTTLGAVTNPPIQAYAFTDENGLTTTMSISSIIDLLANPASQIATFNDTASGLSPLTISGNVGIVAGASGTVRGGQPAQDGVNGDVTNVTAASIMSIVAGSVTNVAPVRIVSGLTVTNNDGVLGADKSPGAPYAPNGQLDYFTSPTSTTSVTNLQAGYSLVGTAADGTPLSGDGAIFASTIQSTSGTPIRGPRVFPAGT